MSPCAFASQANAAQAYVLSDLSTFPFGQECSQENSLKLTACAAYILGAVDELSMSHAICLPMSGGGNSQNLAVVRKYLRDHPESWDQHPAYLVRSAMVATFHAVR
ncbi:Rap1a/Tai family immunity protein [Sphingomonas bacterium]|uniref:Rap1a/Tai family immunity protein n=1 Tax=Sphingomonas bacterium TaxID=1895847 RepID=UPI00349FE4DB